MGSHHTEGTRHNGRLDAVNPRDYDSAIVRGDSARVEYIMPTRSVGVLVCLAPLSPGSARVQDIPVERIPSQLLYDEHVTPCVRHGQEGLCGQERSLR